MPPKTRCDELIEAAREILERFRPLLDSSANIKAVHLDLKIRQDNTIHTANLAPLFESHPVSKAGIEKFDWESS